MAAVETGPAIPVWARRRATTPVCPKAYITGESLAYLQLFAARQRLGFPDAGEMGAREADAMLMLEHEWAKEVASEQR